MNTLFLEPLDVLFLRGNKLFGDPGSYGESLVPPWPSVAAGALRSRMLVDAGIDPAAFGRGTIAHPELGSPTTPGAFAITAFHLGRRHADGRVEALFQPPADLVISERDNGPLTVRALVPTQLHTSESRNIHCSAPLPKLPVLAERERGKPTSGYWLTEGGWEKYLKGKIPDAADLVKSSALWSSDHRVGVGLEAETRRAAEGRLFSVQAVAMKAGVGFLVAAEKGTLPLAGTLRLGGDGRAAAVHPIEKVLPEPEYEAIAAARRCRLVLTSPGIFSTGWLPNGAKPDAQRGDGAIRFELAGVSGWIVAAAVPRFEVVSGWDLAHNRPKPALRAAPIGSVWWIEELEATPEALRKLVAQGLWSDPCEDPIRRAEGFNRFTFAVY